MKNSQGNKDRSWVEPFNIFFWDKLRNNTYKTCITKWIRKDLVLDLCKYVVSNKQKKDLDMKSEHQMKNTCLNLKNRQNFTKVYLYSQKNKKLLMEKKSTEE